MARTKKQTHPRIGAHVSVAGGLYKAVENAQQIGAECFQIFGSSPRQWKTRMPSEEDVKRFKDTLKESGIGPVVLHASYLANIASPIPDLRKKSIQNLSEHLAIAEAIGAEGLIFHIGSGKGIDEEKAVGYVAEGIQKVLKRTEGKAKLIMENTAGGGHRLGGIDDMEAIFKAINWPERVTACFDTAHGFESGIVRYNTKAEVKKLFDEWDKRIGMDRLSFIHANDSATPFDSHHDRHENIGGGEIGEKGFKNLAAEKRLHNIPWIIETPGFDRQGPDKKNINRLRSYF